MTDHFPKRFISFAHVGSQRSLIRRIKSRLDKRRLRGIVAAIAGSQLAVRDVGGGSGQILDQVRAAGPRVRFTQIVDLDSGAEHIAHSAGQENSRCWIELYSGNRNFDLILMLNMIEQVVNPVSVLSKAGSVLSSRGQMLVKTPNFDSLDDRLPRRLSWGGDHCPRHWPLFTARSFERTALSSRLRVDHVSYVRSASFWAISVFEALRSAGFVKASPAASARFYPFIPFLQGPFAAFDSARSPFPSTSQIFAELSRSSEGACN